MDKQTVVQLSYGVLLSNKMELTSDICNNLVRFQRNNAG